MQLRLVFPMLFALSACVSSPATPDPVPSSLPASPLDAALAEIESQTPAYQMRSALRALATAQNEFYKAHGRLTANVDSLQRMPGCTISRQVEIRVLNVSDGGWAARSRHPALPGRSCVQWVSRPNDVPVPSTDREGVRGDTQPGGVVCDTLP